MSGVVRSSLAQVVSAEAILPEEEGGRWQTGGAPPAAVVAPASEEEIAGLLAAATRNGWRVLPAGLGRWLRGGGSLDVDIVLSTARMKGMREYEPPDLTFTAWGGSRLDELQETFRREGQWLPLDPPGGRLGSLGALAALGVAGPLRHGYGTPRDHVLGLTLVTGDGRILRWGGRVVKNVAGFDLTRLSIGSWGALGVITSVSARLFPLPQEDVTLVLQGESAESLLPAARTMALSPLPLSGVELMDPLPCVEAKGAGLVMRLLGSPAQTREMEERIREELGERKTTFLRMAGAESAAFHACVEGWEDGMELVLRLALLPSQLAILLEEARALQSLTRAPEGGAGAGPRLAAHVGAGILRIAIPRIPEEEAVLARWAGTLRELRSRLDRSGGTLGLSLGPSSLMEQVGAWDALGAEGTLVEGLKRQFDPQRVLSPGRFLS